MKKIFFLAFFLSELVLGQTYINADGTLHSNWRIGSFSINDTTNAFILKDAANTKRVSLYIDTLYSNYSTGTVLSTVAWSNLIQAVKDSIQQVRLWKNNTFTGTNTFSAATTFNANVYINTPSAGLYIGGLQRIDINGNIQNASYISNSGIWAQNETGQTWLGYSGAKHLIINGSSTTLGSTARTGTDTLYAGVGIIGTLNVTSSMNSQGSISVSNAQSIYPTTTGTGGLGKYANRWDTLYANNMYGSGAGITNIPFTSVNGLGTMARADSVSYHGNPNITTLGTITTGIWQGTSIDTTYTNAVSKLISGNGITVTKNSKDYTVAVNYNTTNLKITTSQLNTIQDIATTSSPTFVTPNFTGGLNINGVALSDASRNLTTGTITSGLINGQTISSAANFTGTITAAGNIQSASLTPTNLLTGYIPYKSSTTLVNSNIYFDGTNVGIGTTAPGLRLDVAGTAGSPASSGTSQTGSFRIGYSGGQSTVLDFGAYSGSPYGQWIQATDRTNLSLTYPLLLNPNGGNVGIGTNDPLGYKLYNNGTLYNNGNATVAGNIIGSGNYSVYNNFTSGWAGSGYRLDYGVTQASSSNLELDNLTVRKSMSVYELLIRQIKAVNGNLFISSSAKCVSATSTSITFTDPTGHNILPFAAGDLLAAQRLALDGTLQSTLKLEYVEFTVTTVSGLTVTGTWNVAPVSYSDVVGYDFVRKGNNTDAVRQGSIYLAADDNNSPFIDIIDGVASFSDWGSSAKLKARLGKLSGITDNTYGQLSGYGLYSQNAYMTGNVNISGTLTAGDANGFGNTFYAGKIKKNLVQYSNSFTNWSYTVNTLTSGQTGPGGSSDAWLVSRPDAGDDYVTIIPSNYTSLSGKTVTFSIYAKANTANQIQLFIFDNDGTGYLSTNQIFTLQTTWQRYYITRMIRTGTLTAVHVRFYVINSTYPSAIYVADAQLELGSIPTPYQPTDGTLSSSTGYGMWSIAGGFGGTMQNPVVSLNDAGLYVKAAGHTANVLGNGTYIGNWTSTTGFYGTILNENGLSGYQNNSKVFYLDNTGAKIANFNISTDNISTGAFNTLNTLYFGSTGLSLSNTFSVTAAGALTATNATITGNITATSGTFTGTVNASAGNFTGYVTAGTSRFGAGVQTGKNGLWLNAGNYLYDDGSFQLGTSTGITYAGSGNVTVGSNTTFTGNITSTATITGGTIQTATSGQRAILYGTGMQFYDASNVVINLIAGSGALLIDHPINPSGINLGVSDITFTGGKILWGTRNLYAVSGSLKTDGAFQASNMIYNVYNDNTQYSTTSTTYVNQFTKVFVYHTGNHYARLTAGIWNNTAGGISTTAKITVNGVSNTITTTSTTIDYKNCTIDISGLTDGNIYTIAVDLQVSGGTGFMQYSILTIESN